MAQFALDLNMNKVKELAAAKYWSMSELSRQTGLSLSTLMSLAAKRRRARLRTAHILADSLGVKVDDIIEKED